MRERLKREILDLLEGELDIFDYYNGHCVVPVYGYKEDLKWKLLMLLENVGGLE